jgi:ribosomal peptide maturation radical SAM protein 1
MRLALISMPWAIFNRQSVQLGVLKSWLVCQEQQIEVQCLHPYLDIAAAIGLDTYRVIAESPWAAEALYCGLLFPEMVKTAEQVFQQSMSRKTALYPNLLAPLENQLQHWLDRHDFSSCDLVAFSVCFSQLPASLYAARAVKQRWPDLTIAFGGSTCTSELGSSLLTVFPEIDYIITGEGEQPLHELMLCLAAGNPVPANPNILTRKKKHPLLLAEAVPIYPSINDLGQLPLPDYSDYFQEVKAGSLRFNPVLPLEFSRGCWWNRCTFCNLNLQWHGYRFKTSSQMLNEVTAMVDKYQCIDFTFTDNALPIKEADLFFTKLADTAMDLRFFAEIRTLKKPGTYAEYRKGGLSAVQIGIEALSDSLLLRMRKGTTVMENLAAMKYAMAAGIILEGNLILEFPGSTEQEAAETLQLLELVLPFRPLAAAGFFLGHGSPVCSNPRSYGIRAVTQHPNNKKLYPAPVLQQLDMLIKSYRGDRTVQKKQWQPVRAKIEQWHTFHRQRQDPSIPALSYRDGGSFIDIRQELPNSPPLHHRLSGLSRKIYLACEQPITKNRLLSSFSQVTKKQLLTFLTDLEQKKILFSNTTSCLALAVRQPNTAKS